MLPSTKKWLALSLTVFVVLAAAMTLFVSAEKGTVFTFTEETEDEISNENIQPDSVPFAGSGTQSDKNSPVCCCKCCQVWLILYTVLTVIYVIIHAASYFIKRRK